MGRLTNSSLCGRISRRLYRAMFAATIVACLGTLPANAGPVLWGIHEDEGRLFSIDDYTNLQPNPPLPVDPYTIAGLGFMLYEPLFYEDSSGDERDLKKDIEALAIDQATGRAYMALNSSRTGYVKPVLFWIDLNVVKSGGSTKVTIVDTFRDLITDEEAQMITGLAFDPISGQLYALDRRDNDDEPDWLLTVNPLTAKTTHVGVLTDGMDEEVGEGEDLEFDHLGRLFVADNDGDDLYEVDEANANILGVLDNDLSGGLPFANVKFEALAWDRFNGTLVGTEDVNDLFAEITLADNGNNTSLGRFLALTDVEGLDFYPIPEPSSFVLAVTATLCVWLIARRRVPHITAHPLEL